MSETYAKPILEFRQVRHDNFNFGSMARDIYYTVQQKWLVFDGVSSDIKKHTCGSLDGTEINYIKGRDEWRDLPTIVEKESG